MHTLDRKARHSLHAFMTRSTWSKHPRPQWYHKTPWQTSAELPIPIQTTNELLIDHTQ